MIKKLFPFQFSSFSSLALCYESIFAFMAFSKRGLHIHTRDEFSCSMKLTWIMTNFVAAHIFRSKIYIFTIFLSPHTYHETKIGALEKWDLFRGCMTGTKVFSCSFFSGRRKIYIWKVFLPLDEEGEFFCSNWQKTFMIYDICEMFRIGVLPFNFFCGSLARYSGERK